VANPIDLPPAFLLVYRCRYKAEYPGGGVSMTRFIFTFLNGLTLAGLYFLVASGLTLIFGLMRVINLAHGAFYLLSGYVSWTIADKTDNWFYGAVAGSLTLGVFGTLVYVLLLRKFQYEELRVALITLGVALVLAQAMLAIFGGDYYQTNYPESVSFSVPIPGLGLSYPFFRIFVLILAIIVAVGLWVFISKTRYGAIIRAGVDDTTMVSALGINVQAVFIWIFFLGSLLVGFAGAVGGTTNSFGMGTDGDYLLFSLQVVIIGGLGSIGGVAIGSFLVGVIGQFATGYYPTFAGMITFAMLILVLAFRPQGILGKKQ
jgi:branched-chain amino acid transport system permease protein